MEMNKLKPKGPWILVKVDPPEEMRGSLYLPQGNLEDRMGSATGTVLALGDGTPTKPAVAHRTGRKYDPFDLSIGARVMFRGFLQEANRPGGILDKEHCLIHANDIIGELLPE
jgi:co-chaperonin GroES (HSP10)